MEQTKIKYGIWSGRFHIINKGQEFVLQYVDKNYPNVCIGIVNPIPSDPARDARKHPEFEISQNPFTYFQRVYLWNLVLRHHSIEAVIVPHWFPRKSLSLESTFLPYYRISREWVFPNLKGEAYKINDFEDAGERVHLMTNEEPDDLKSINSFHIKRMFDNKDKNFQTYIPEVIQLKTEIFMKKEELEEDFIVIPIIGDNLHPLLIYGGIQLRIDKNKKLIFAPVVRVQNNDNWCKMQSENDGYFTFYQKHEIINSIMSSIDFYDYIVVPIILKDDKCEKIEAFLPDTSKRSWFLLPKINRIKAFKQFQLEKNFGTDFDFHTICDNLFIKVYAREFELFNEMNYYTNYYDDSESEEIQKMPKYDIHSNNNVTIVEHIQGDVQFNTADTPLTAEAVIKEILSTDNEKAFSDLLKQAEPLFKNKTQADTQQTIEKIVKQYIDSTEKKKAFIEKIKMFTYNICTSFIGSLILQAVNELHL